MNKRLDEITKELREEKGLDDSQGHRRELRHETADIIDAMAAIIRAVYDALEHGVISKTGRISRLCREFEEGVER